ncbi:MAG: hypothetical protein RSC80_07655, partial [Odoribacter sp.]
MVKKLFLLLLVMQLVVRVFAQMSDEQVINLLQNAQEKGMRQQEMLLMLSQKGVTQDQLLRIKEKYGQNPSENVTTNAVGNRMRQSENNANPKNP